MAIGVFGNIRPADIKPSDLEVFYTFTPNRETAPGAFTALTSTDILTEFKLPSSDANFVSGNENLMGGVYSLKLQASVFNQLGIYLVYLRPKLVSIKITDCGVLSAIPTVKGIVLNINNLDASLAVNNALQGYRIEYLQTDGTKLRNVVRYVTTSNRVVPVTDNISNTSQTAVRYRFDDSGNLLFLQVTPSSASSVKPNIAPFIGTPNQTILLSNTAVNPEVVEIDMVENTIDTLADYIAGDQIKDVQKGILTYYDKDGNIMKQFDVYEAEDSINKQINYEVKTVRTTIDTSEELSSVLNQISGT